MSEPMRDDVRELLAATAGRPDGKPPLVEFLKIIQRNLAILVAAIVIGAGAGLLWASGAPVTYTAHAVVRSAGAAPGGDPRVAGSLPSFLPFFQSRATIAKALSDAGAEAGGMTVDEVMARITSTPIAATNTIVVSLTASTSAASAAIVNRVASIGAAAATNAALQDVKTLEDRLAQSVTAEQSAYAAAAQRALARRRVLQVERLRAETKALSIEGAKLLTVEAEIADARATLAALNAARASAGAGEAAERIEEQAALAAGKLAGLEAQKTHLTTALQLPRLESDKLGALYAAESEMKQLDLDVKVASSSYTAAAARYRAFVADRDVNRAVFSVVDPALPPGPTVPSKQPKIFVAIAGALALAALVIGLREGLRAR